MAHKKRGANKTQVSKRLRLHNVVAVANTNQQERTGRHTNTRSGQKRCRKAAYSLVSGALAVWNRNQTLLQFTTYHLQE